jgi:ketosteroid isomerase-like protein
LRPPKGVEVASQEQLETNKNVVREHMAALGRQDIDAQGALMTDDVQWWVPPSAVETGGFDRPVVGKAAVLKFLSGGSKLFTESNFTIDQLVAEDDFVAAHAHMEGRTSIGKDYLNYYHFLYRLDGGRIAEIWEHVDTAYAFSRFVP